MQVAFDLLEQMNSCPGQFREQPDEVLYNCMIDMCVRFKDLPRAIWLFEQMQRGGAAPRKQGRRRSQPSVQPSAVTYGILIKAFGQEN